MGALWAVLGLEAAIGLVRRMIRWWRPLLWAVLLSWALSLWALISLWLLPAGLAYLHIVPWAPGSERPAAVDRWRSDWLERPDLTTQALLSPGTGQRWLRVEWLAAQVVFASLIGLVWLRKAGRHGAPQAASQYGSHGSTRWRKASEFFSTLDTRGPGLLIGKLPAIRRVRPLYHPNISEERRGGLNQNALVLGGSGAGKTRCFVLPNLLQIEHESVIITDPKGELFDLSAAHFRSRGYDVRLINFISMAHSDRYNPMAALHTPGDARDLARTFIENTSPPEGEHGDAFWRQAEEALLAALVLYLQEERPPEERHMGSVYELLTVLGGSGELDAVFASLPDHSAARRAYGTFRLAEDKTRNGILIGLAARMALWSDATVVSLTAAQDFDIGDPGRRRMAIFLALHDSKSTYDVIAALFFSQLFQALYDLAGHSPGLRLPTPVRCFMDEWANIGHIPDFAKKISTMRSRGIRVVLVLQELGQLKKLYPRSRTTILGNCDTQLYLGTNDLDTCRYFSDKLGHQTVAVHSYSGHSRGGVAMSYTGRPLLTPDELQRFPRTESILFQTGQLPARLPKLDYSDLPEARHLERSDHNRYAGAFRTAAVITAAQTLVPRQPVEADAGDALRPRDPLGYLDG